MKYQNILILYSIQYLPVLQFIKHCLPKDVEIHFNLKIQIYIYEFLDIYKYM